MEKIRRFLGLAKDNVPTSTSEPMTDRKVDFSFRIYWTKISHERKWNLSIVRKLRPNVAAVIAQPDFENNLIDRRYKVDGLDELAHSGASLLALLEVLDALEKSYAEIEGD